MVLYVLLCRSVCYFLYGPFCHGALKLDISTVLKAKKLISKETIKKIKRYMYFLFCFSYLNSFVLDWYYYLEKNIVFHITTKFFFLKS